MPYKPAFRKQATLALITVDENTNRLVNYNKLRDSPPPYEELENFSDSVSIRMPSAILSEFRIQGEYYVPVRQTEAVVRLFKRL